MAGIAVVAAVVAHLADDDLADSIDPHVFDEVFGRLLIVGLGTGAVRQTRIGLKAGVVEHPGVLGTVDNGVRGGHGSQSGGVGRGRVQCTHNNLLVADSPNGASLEMRAESTSYHGPGQAAQRNDALMSTQVSTATVAMRWRRSAHSVPALEEYRSPCSYPCIAVISLEEAIF